MIFADHVSLAETISQENWCQGAVAVSADSQEFASALATDAVAWCLSGHVERVLPRDILQQAEWLGRLAQAICALYPERLGLAERDDFHIVVQFNDHDATIVDDVIRVCKVAGL